MKFVCTLILCLALMLSLFGCGKEPKLLHCDGCGKELTVDGNSNMEEDWIVLCPQCEEEALGDLAQES